MLNEIILGDCLEVMKLIPDGSVDMILCDLPYGTTACAWDSIIPFDALWEAYKRVLKPTGTVVLTASQPFTTALIASQYELFKYCLVWEKSRATGHAHAKNKPMKAHEDICVFSKGTTVHASQSPTRMTYNPQGLVEVNQVIKHNRKKSSDTGFSARPSHRDHVRTHTGYPRSVLRFASEGKPVHPTQKPVALFEYLIKTYTNPGEVVLDNCIGSGTTAIAALNTGRRFIGIERDPQYHLLAVERVQARQRELLPSWLLPR